MTSITSALRLTSKISLSSMFSFQSPSLVFWLLFFLYYCPTGYPQHSIAFLVFVTYMSVTTPNSFVPIRHFLLNLTDC